jgi:formamidopyrimidine-DNA glycosylase
MLGTLAMPEMPEVETMVRDLAARVTGRTVTAVETTFPGLIVWPTYTEFDRRVSAQSIRTLSRRGKYALFGLASGDLLILHRGMSGSLLLRRPEQAMEQHVRLLFHLDDGSQLRFNDPRKFGKVYVMDATGNERELPWAHIGPEPLGNDFSSELLHSALRRRTGLIKPLLLNQRLVAGLGNIYVDEALHVARIHPERRAHTLTSPEVKRLHGAIRHVLGAAVERRGTTFSTYMDVEGRAGMYQDRLRVFGRQGSTCPRCGEAIEKIVVGGRGTHICPCCQRV